MTREEIARVAHDVNAAYCRALGDDSQPAWEDAPEWQRESAINGVNLHQNGHHGPQVSHENWMKEKLDAGWTFGAIKDPGAKTHPCLVPFNKLPVAQQAKDFIFKAIVEALS